MTDRPSGVWWNGEPLHENPDGIRVAGWTREEVLDRLILARTEYEMRRGRAVRPKSRRNGR